MEMLKVIEKARTIYNISYRNAGVGFLFYNPTKVYPGGSKNEEWRKSLTVDRYYDTFEQAVKAEFDRLEQALPDYGIGCDRCGLRKTFWKFRKCIGNKKHASSQE